MSIIDFDQTGKANFNGSEPIKDLPDFISLDVEAANGLGRRHYLAGDLAKAEECFLAVVRAQPGHAHAWSNLGLVWQSTGHLDDALKCYINAFSIDPNIPSVLANLGYLHETSGLWGHATRFFERALEVSPNNPRAMGSLGHLLLKQHEYARGWPMMEARFKTEPRISFMRDYAIPLWDGKPCQKLGVWPEQGVGDQLLYATLLTELVAMGQDFVCEIDPRLIPALQRNFPAAEFVPKDTDYKTYDKAAFAGCDAHIPMMSLGQFFRNSVEDFERQPKRIMKPDFALADAGPWGKKRIAISWRSFPNNQLALAMQMRKSATLADYEALGRREDVELVTVQYGDNDAELAAWEWNPIHRPKIDLFNDIEGVLATISMCDAVVTTSNVTAHFAGALGVPCYLIYLRANPPFFYWSPLQSGRSAWYPSVQIVSGEGITTWREAIALVNEML